MTQEEFDAVLKPYRDEGVSDEEIAAAMAMAFEAGDLKRGPFEAILGALGFEIDGEYADMSDEELAEAIRKETKGDEEGVSKKEAVEGLDGSENIGGKRKGHDKSEDYDDDDDDDEEVEEKVEVKEKSEGKSEDKDDKEDDDDEEERAMRLMGY